MSNPLHDNASLWWQEEGPFKVLHQLAPLRLSFILEKVGNLAGLSVLDVGCGGGLLAEPCARLGATVTALDDCSQAIEAARSHNPGLPITYQVNTLEAFSCTNPYDVVMAFEVIEHTESALTFLTHCKRCIKPGGWLLGSTLNRTTLAYIMGIVMAERVLKWVPPGTHEISKFLTPNEWEAIAKASGFEATTVQGFSFNPLKNKWGLSKNTAINYFFAAHG